MSTLVLPSLVSADPDILLSSMPAARFGIDMKKLIGQPHLFCRVRDLREGLLFEPIGNMTLQPDGRVTGYAHPNEGSWIPYLHGQVSGDEALSPFVTAHNNWIPSSTWTQSMGDIPVGYFCDEPEHQSAMQRLCLIPQTPLPEADRARLPRRLVLCAFTSARSLRLLIADVRGGNPSLSRSKSSSTAAPRTRIAQIDGIDHAFTRRMTPGNGAPCTRPRSGGSSTTASSCTTPT